MAKPVTKTIRLGGSERLRANSRYTFDVVPPKNHRLVACTLMCGPSGAPKDVAIVNCRKISFRIVGPTRVVQVYALVVFEKVEPPVVVEAKVA